MEQILSVSCLPLPPERLSPLDLKLTDKNGDTTGLRVHECGPLQRYLPCLDLVLVDHEPRHLSRTDYLHGYLRINRLILAELPMFNTHLDFHERFVIPAVVWWLFRSFYQLAHRDFTIVVQTEFDQPVVLLTGLEFYPRTGFRFKLHFVPMPGLLPSPLDFYKRFA